MKDFERLSMPGGAFPSSAITRIRCTHCSGLIPPPFALARVPIANTHVNPADPHGTRCRVIVVPDPNGKHLIRPVHDGETLEDAMRHVLQELGRAA